MRHASARHAVLTALLALSGLLGLSRPAAAVVYLTGSVSASTTNAGLQSYSARGGSASLGFDLGSYIRLGFTHKQQFQESEGLIAREEETACEPPSQENCAEYSSKTHIIANSVDLTLILYEGDVIVPFIMGGAVVKAYDFETVKDGEYSKDKATAGPVPNLGGGLGIRLNKQFQLKLTYTASPGVTIDREGEQRSVWDRDTSIGLTYQL